MNHAALTGGGPVRGRSSGRGSRPPTPVAEAGHHLSGSLGEDELLSQLHVGPALRWGAANQIDVSHEDVKSSKKLKMGLDFTVTLSGRKTPGHCDRTWCLTSFSELEFDRLDTMGLTVTLWLDSGSASVLRRTQPSEDTTDIRLPSTKWDGQYAHFKLGRSSTHLECQVFKRPYHVSALPRMQTLI